MPNWIVPVIGKEPIALDAITVRVSQLDRDRAENLVRSTGFIRSVSDEGGFSEAKRAAGQLKAMINEIEDSKKTAKRPFTAVGKAVDQLVLEVGAPVEKEHKRILSLLNGYVARLEAEAKEETRKKEAALQQEIQEARAAQAKAEAEAATAKDALEAERKAFAAMEAQLSAEMAGEIARIGQQPKRGLVTGGRVDHKYEFILRNVRETVRAGGWQLLRFELNKLACQDSCRSQEDINPDAEPKLPGIEVKRFVNVSVKASAKIE
jgi:hypothetical protein